MGTRNLWTLVHVLGACFVCGHLSQTTSGQTPGLSPGPSGRLSGTDHRVPLIWISKSADYGPGDYGRRFTYGGRERYYEIHAPTNYKPGRPMPVVFALHGGGGFASKMRTISGMDRLGDKHGFIVVYCAGTHEDFSDRRLCWNIVGRGPDDVGYIKYVLDDLPSYFSIDKDRIYAMGPSNGAQMTFRIGAELSEYFAAIGTVAGQRGPTEFSKRPGRPVPLIHFHGRKDVWCPIEGGMGRTPPDRPPWQFQSVEAVISAWVRHNRSKLTPEISLVGKSARRYTYKASEDGVDTILWILEDAGHTWPGGPPPSRFQRSQDVGRTNRDISASELMWQFFKRHKLDRPPN